jgi:arsenate reductase
MNQSRRVQTVIPALVSCVYLAGTQLLGSTSALEQRWTRITPQRTTVLFICQHGAAKSVLASAYFQRLADQRGLRVRVESVGVEPQESVSPVVMEHLQRNGYTVPVTKPRVVTEKDLDAADVVIAMGCDLKGLPAAPRRLQQWDDVPGPSEDLAGADEVIRRRVVVLVEELLGQQQK